MGCRMIRDHPRHPRKFPALRVVVQTRFELRPQKSSHFICIPKENRGVSAENYCPATNTLPMKTVPRPHIRQSADELPVDGARMISAMVRSASYAG
jgi:hypothetical protein